jgi:hypothetical protein
MTGANLLHLCNQPVEWRGAAHPFLCMPHQEAPDDISLILVKDGDFAKHIATELWGEGLLAIFGPEFTSAKVPLLILMACQLARVLFGPSVLLLTVIGAQRQSAALGIAALIVLSSANLMLTPLYGALGAAIAVAIATPFWLVACAIVLGRLSGLRTDVLHLVGKLGSPRSAPA